MDIDVENLEFVIANEPDLYPMDTETYLYNDKAYLQSKEERFGRPITCYALDGDKAVAKIHFFMIKQNSGETEAVSIPASPFGSIEYDKNISATALTDFIHYFKNNLLARQVKNILIKDCIAAYRNDGRQDLSEILIKSGFQIEEKLINHHIEVDDESLSQKMHPMEVRRLKKCDNAGFILSYEPTTSIDEIYEFIRTCRAEKGWNLSMSKDEIRETAENLPLNYLLLSVKDQEEMVAASIAVLVNKNILYNFYPASRIDYTPFSPTVMLTYGLYQYCQQAKIKILDLGTSPTLSLQGFKQHLGGLSSYKRSYQYCAV